MSVRRAKHLRQVTTATERLIWAVLKNRQFSGLKFRRQMPIGPYVADFVCLRRRLTIEADGPFHDVERDQVRDAWLASQGFRILRFASAEVTPDRITAAIAAATEAPLQPDR